MLLIIIMLLWCDSNFQILGNETHRHAGAERVAVTLRAPIGWRHPTMGDSDVLALLPAPLGELEPVEQVGEGAGTVAGVAQILAGVPGGGCGRHGWGLLDVTGWYGCGSLLRAHIPTKQVSAAPSTVVSKVTGMNAGQLKNGLPLASAVSRM